MISWDIYSKVNEITRVKDRVIAIITVTRWVVYRCAKPKRLVHLYTIRDSINEMIDKNTIKE